MGSTGTRPATATCLDRPMTELIHAEMSMIGNGIAQAGGGFDFKQATPEFMAFLKKLFAFRKRFERYFDTYQHVLGFPDGKHDRRRGAPDRRQGLHRAGEPDPRGADGSSPAGRESSWSLPGDKKHELTDWSNLDTGRAAGRVHHRRARRRDAGAA